FTFVFGSEHTAIAVLNSRIDDVRILAVEVQTDSARVALRKARCQFPPGAASINSLVNSASRTTTVEAPTAPPPLIGCRKQHFGIGWIHDDIDRTGVFIDREHLLPVDAAVGCHVNTALRVRTPEMAECGNINDVGILRIDDDPANVIRLAKTEVLPRF